MRLGLSLAVSGAAAAQSPAAAATARPLRQLRRILAAPLLQFGDEMAGVLLVLLEELQAGLQQRLQFGILGVGDQRRFQCAVDRLVVGDLVLGVGDVVGVAAQLGVVRQLLLGGGRQRLA